MTPVHPNTKLRLLDHLGQAEIELRVAAQFECCKATPAHHDVRAALALVGQAKRRLNEKVPVEPTAPNVAISPREQHRAINRRMARLAP